MNLFGTIHVDCIDLEPTFHCSHADERVTVKFDNKFQGLDVALTGTPHEIAVFARKLYAVATQAMDYALAEIDAK